MPKERWHHRNVFETYLLLGPGRSLKLLQEQTGINGRTLGLWSSQFGWKDRLAVRDQKAIQALEKESDKVYLEEVKKRHRDAYQGVQEKALKYIDRKAVFFENDKDAAIALDIGIKGEREVLGLRDTKVRAGIVSEGFAAFMEAVMKPE